MSRGLLLIVLCSTGLMTAQVQAQDAPPRHLVDAGPLTLPSLPTAADTGAALDEATLGELSGGADTTTIQAFTSQQLSAVNRGNSVTADSVVSGAVTFGEGALVGYNGLGNFVINTGSNNNLQGSLSVTVITTP